MQNNLWIKTFNDHNANEIDDKDKHFCMLSFITLDLNFES